MKENLTEINGRDNSKLYDQKNQNSRESISKIISSMNLTFLPTTEKVHADDLEEICSRASSYINHCATYGNLPTMQGLSGWLGITRKTLYEWLKNYNKPKTVELLERIRDFIADVSTQAATKGKVNTVAWIFYAKNYFDMRDSVEVEVGAKNILEPQKTQEELERLYSNNDVED